jgi:hypothetical protein
VTNTYLRDSLIDMTAVEKTQRDAGSIHTERIGKVFVAVGQDVRKCLICEQLFTRRAASEHAKIACRVKF